MIDIQKLSKKEILELERQIQEYKKTEKFLTGYKVTFCVKFNPIFHTDDVLCDEDTFGDYLTNTIAEKIANDLRTKLPEDVSGFEVMEMTEEDKEYWKSWWGS